MLGLLIIGAILLIVGIGLQRSGIEPWGWILSAVGAVLLLVALIVLVLELADDAGEKDGLALVALGMAYGGRLKTMGREKKSVLQAEIQRVDDRARNVTKLASRVRRPRARKGPGGGKATIPPRPY